MNTRGRRIDPIVAGIIAGLVMIGIVLVFAYINVKFAAPWSSTHSVAVETTDADGISVSSDVRIEGRLVGQVTEVRATGRTAIVTLNIDGAEWPLPGNTTASVRLATLLGQKFIELQPPASGASGQLPEGGVIKGARPVVDFDQILNTFDAPTREAVKDILATGGRAVANQEGTIQNLVPDLATLNQLGQVPTAELANRDAELNAILQNLAVTADQLAASRDDLVGVVNNANRLTGTLAANTDTLRTFIRDGDQTLQLTDQALGNGYATKLSNDLIHLNPVVHDLKALLDDIYPQAQTLIKCCIPAGKSLVYEIGDALSQSDRDGFFLRQNLQTIDLSNILPSQSPTGLGSGSAPPPSHGLPAVLPTLPLPPLPLPPLPPVCVGSLCIGAPGSSPPPPTPCVLGIVPGLCTRTTAFTGPAGPSATTTGDGSSSFDYAAAVSAMWGKV